ncbi:MAG: STAS domain-containing protein [Candidatus Eremiobacteraeota bacterium]|nr:STAS domain-containing protein [Candidatus Eremiobacteraeota bacterium]MBV8338342.1 STAS domain-containing protein [Candidatus Eremiobacteraeota bacterium]MBV8596990.1 STAS domain-containing protein [Candidatus Eremiobacteraeota bacterium]
MEPLKTQTYSLNQPAFVHDSQADAEALHVYGEIDLTAEREFESMIEKVAVDGRPIVIDLTACTYIDSCAIHILQRASTRHDVRVVAAEHSTIQRVFQIAGANEFLELAYRPVPHIA